jgi:hypothetical protein
MNLKFLDNIFQTIDSMKTGFYYLQLLAGVQTVAFTLYLVYKYFNNESKSDSECESECESECKSELNKLVIEEEMNHLSEELQNILLQKRDELNLLISQLDIVYDNIGGIRERLDEFNNKPIS